MGYPGITLNKDGEIVNGFLFISDNLSEHWSELDEFEGEAYKRVLTTITLQDKSTVDSYIYTLKQTTPS